MITTEPWIGYTLYTVHANEDTYKHKYTYKGQFTGHYITLHEHSTPSEPPPAEVSYQH